MKPKVTITFSTGDVVKLELYRDIAPLSVDNFLSYAKSGFYEGTIMHRIIEGFMIQGGGYYIEGNSLKSKSVNAPIKGEFLENGYKKNTLKHEAGVISCARTTVNNSATSQFFICSAPSSYLDGKYAAFGKVTCEESLNAVIKISQVQTGKFGQFADFPINPISITKIEIED